MSRVVFIGLSAYGHINPTLSIVKELILRGEEVIYIASNKYKNLVSSLGCKHVEFKYSKLLFGSHHLNSKTKRTESEFLSSIKQFYASMESQRILANKLKQLIQNLSADYIIHDSTMFYVKYICDELQIPCISSITLFALNEAMFVKSKTLLSDFYNVDLKNSPQFVVDCIKQIELENYLKIGYKHSYLDNSMTKQGLNIVYTSKEFQPYSELLDNSYHFAGNNLQYRKTLEIKQDYNLPKGKKVVLISFGSIMSSNKDLVNFYSQMMKYFSKYDAIFILNIGNLSKAIFDFVPENFILKNGINQLELLCLSDLFITHGGMNSVSEAIQLNAPMIVIPKAMDQFLVAEQVEKIGVGQIIKKDNIDFNELESLISKILENSNYSKNTERIADTYRSTGEEKVAVDKIFEYVRK